MRPAIRRLRRAACGLLCTAVGAAAAAQTPASASRPFAADLRIAAADSALWIAEVGTRQSQLFHRSAAGAFDAGRLVNGRIALMSAAGGDVLVFIDDGSLYRYGPRTSASQIQLPGPTVPLQVAADDDRAFALVPASVAAQLAARAGAAGPPSGDDREALCLVGFDGWEWSLLSACPADARANRRAGLDPVLVLHRDAVMLVYPHASNPHGIRTATFQPTSAAWIESGDLTLPGLARFWAVRVSGVPTLLAVQAGADGRSNLSAHRLLGGVDPRGGWQPAPLHESEPRVEPKVYADAFGFNQCIGLLVLDSAGEPYLQFAGFGAPPPEPTRRVRDLLERPVVRQQVHDVVRTLTLLVLVGVLAALFAFRWQALLRTGTLPEGVELSYTSQRFVGGLIDFGAFAGIFALWLGVDWAAALRDLAAWGLGTSGDGDPPEINVLVWWGASCSAYTLYALGLELLTSRTVGKTITRIRVAGENGAAAARWRIVVRNLFRPIELLPQLWVLSLLVLVSRNRQRLGDIFAGTVVVRTRRPPRTASGDGNEDAPDDGDAPGGGNA